MKTFTLTLSLLALAACSGSGGGDPQASGSADAATDAASAASTDKPQEAPMTAERCIEDNKGLGTGTRGEMTKDCLVGACEQGDKKSCEMTKSFSSDEEGAGDQAAEDDAGG